jgi:hypothetical protein
MDLGLIDRAAIVTGGPRGILVNVVGAAWSADSGAVASIF